MVSLCSSHRIFQPLYLYYYQSAEFTRKKKWKEAVKVWLIWTIIPVCLGVLGWLYLYSTTDKVRFDYKWNRDFVIALSNA